MGESMYPDFIFFQQLPDGTIIRTIVDPHGDWLGDSIARSEGICPVSKRLSNYVWVCPGGNR